MNDRGRLEPSTRMFHTFLPLTKRQNCEQDGKNGWQGSFRSGDRNGAVVESASIDLETGGLDAALAVISVCNRNPRSVKQ